MPAVSKAQRIAAAIAEHHPEKAKGAAKQMANSMSKEQLHHFSATSTKGLPEKKAEFTALELEYLQGFVTKCSEHALDPEILLLKTAADEAEHHKKHKVRDIVIGAGKGALAGGVIGAAGSTALAAPFIAGNRNNTRQQKVQALLRTAITGGLQGVATGGVVGGVNQASK